MYSLIEAQKAFKHESRNYYQKHIQPAILKGEYCYKTRKLKSKIPRKRVITIGFIDGIKEFEIQR